MDGVSALSLIEGLNRAIIARLKTSAGCSPSLSPQLGAGLLESAAGALQRNISPSTMHTLRLR